MERKLTPAQIKLLRRLDKGPADRWATGYNIGTARFLVRNDLARALGFASYGYSSIEITDQGRKALFALALECECDCGCKLTVNHAHSICDRCACGEHRGMRSTLQNA